MLQPAGSVIELCHVVNDIDAAIEHWTMVMGAGPFYVGAIELTRNQFHRGRPCEQSIEVAFGYSGGLVIELVRPIRDLPSVFREVLEARGPGYHHVMQRVDYDRGYEQLSRAGYEPALHCVMPGGERCTLFDTQAANGGFIEIMDFSPLILRQLENMARAHHEWDHHTRPVRPLAESFA